MNIICIVNDSLRADHCGSYDGVGGINTVQYHTAEGVKKTATPNLDRLAAEGVLFSHCYAESLPTIPTRTTWWTGRVGFPFRPWQPFRESDYLLAEVLWSHGYTSALVTDVYHGHKPVYNIGRGFDTTVFVRGQEYDPWIVDDRTVDTNIWHRLRGDDTDPLWAPRFEQYMKNRSTFQTEEDFFAPRVTHEAIRWLDAIVNQQGKKDKLFLWVDYFDPHEPWDPHDQFWTMYKAADYSGQDIIDTVAGTCTKI
ncbi:sulfatase-like hydrolase/transferase, partial [Candidatus Poribacteria bacterium]|nr:sulfatase-like hydrolase/transferase [Candidatus Poribacteria bacterium]